MNYPINHNQPSQNRAKAVLDYIADRMPSADRNSSNPVDSLSTNDIKWMIKYLTTIVDNREKNMYPNIMNIEPGVRGSISTRSNKRSQYEEPDFTWMPEYHNPYELGPRHNPLKPRINQPFDRSNVRDIDVESFFKQTEIRNPGQKKLVESEVNRFDYLPFGNPNPDNIVWADNLPRGGISTRTDKYDYGK